MKLIMRCLVVNALLLWQVAFGGIILASDEHIRRLAPTDVEPLARAAVFLLLLLPLPFVFGICWLRRLTPERRPLSAALRRGGKTLGWAYVALLAFSFSVNAACLRASMTWMRGNKVYRVGVEPRVLLPGISRGYPGGVQCHFLCFYGDVGPVFRF